MGADEDMQYIGDPNAFLLAYATNAPSVDEPSAGYIFTWDMLGNGQMLPILNYLGENGTHTEYIEGLMATDMKKTSDDLARFYKAAPSVFSVSHCKSIIDNFLSAEKEIYQSSERSGCMVCTINMNMYSATAMRNPAEFFKFTDYCLKCFNIFIIKRWCYKFNSIFIHQFTSRFSNWTNT